MTRFEENHYDAIIIGARCAGSATALLLSRAGARVLLVDRDQPGNDTLSTHALMRPAVQLLHDWGVLDAVWQAGTPLIRHTTFHYGSEAIPVAIQPDGDVPGLFAPRRSLLDRVLADAAVEAGAELHTGVTFQDAIKDVYGRILGAELIHADGTAHTVYSRILIGADGRMSSVARSVGAHTRLVAPERSSLVYGYFDGLKNKGYRWYFGDASYAGAIPTNDGAHCIFAAVKPSEFKATFAADPISGMAGVIRQCDPELADQMRGLAVAGHLRRFAGAPGFMRDCAGLGWALVGDAGYFRDPSTAHGITDAFLDARRLTRAMERQPDRPVAYQTERDAMSRGLFDVTRKIAALDWDLDHAKALHRQLNTCMKLEIEDLQGGRIPHTQAA